MNESEKIHGKLYKYSHFMMFEDVSPYFRDIIRYYIKKNLTAKELVKENGRFKVVDGKVYAARNTDKTQLHLHINCWESLNQHFNQWGISLEKNFEIIEVGFDDYPIVESHLKVKENFILRDYQVDALNDIMSDGSRKVINLSMGFGKSVCALKAIETLGCRSAITVLPKFKGKWIEDMVGYCSNLESPSGRKDEHKYEVLDTYDKLVSFIDDCIAGDTHPDKWVLIITLTVLKRYMDEYQNAPESTREFMVHPVLIWKTMGIGLRITDEAHEHFHLNYMLDLQTHMPKTIYLSATLDPSGAFNEKMYRQFFPVDERQGGNLRKQYTEIIAVFYRHKNVERWPCNMQGKYSHTAYENNFLRGKLAEKLRQQYFGMIARLLEEHYFNVRKEGQKAIVFFATIEMCTLFTEYLKKEYPLVDTRRYVGEDDYEELMKAEIAVSTTGSAGTAVDIPGLITNIMTISRKSKQSNLQIMGRLRELKNTDQKPRFIYLVMRDMQTSMNYHEEKKTLFADRALSHVEVDSQVVLDK